ncbi:MAG: hypothetical protein V4736_16340 [Bdellovibrionota bacterium]
MKTILKTTLAALMIQSTAFGATEVSLTNVAQRVSKANYMVYETALKVYQAKANVDKARADLLPRLNIWTIGSLLIDPLNIIDNVGDIAPFLVPANWFRVSEVKYLHLAEAEGYRALWGNEVLAAKTLYRNALLDKKLLAHVSKSIDELSVIHRTIKTREVLGGATPGGARDIEIKLLGLQEDRANLKVLVASEMDELAYALGYPIGTDLTLASVTMPAFDTLKPIDAREYEFRALAVSPERRQYEHFFSVLSQIKKEIAYNVFGGSTISRGVAGGIFDNLPTGGGLGLGNGSAMKIVQAQKEIMKSQKLGIEETLKRQLRAIATQYNSDLSNYGNYRRRSSLARESRDSLVRRIQLGDNINLSDLSENARSLVQAETALLTMNYRFLANQDRLNRILFEGDYNTNPPLIKSLKGLQ